MPEIIFGPSVLKAKGLEPKFDVIPASNSMAILLGSMDKASIVQQLYYWGLKGYGEVIDGVRWFYKPIREWIEEVFPTLSPWQLTKLMNQLVELGVVRREKLFTKHQIQQGARFWWQPKNQTYYYSLNTERLQEVAENYETDGAFKDSNSISVPAPPETLENSVFEKTQKLSNEEIQDTKFSDYPKNNTKNTSTENSSREKSHPTLPLRESGMSGKDNKDRKHPSNSELSSSKEPESNQVNSVTSKAVKRDKSSGEVEEKVNEYSSSVQESVRELEEKANQNSCSVQEPVRELEEKANQNGRSVQEPVRVEEPANQNSRSVQEPVRGGNVQEPVQVEKVVPKPKLSKTPKGTKPSRKDKAPWKDEGQFKRFYRALIQALPIVANSHSPQGLAQTIIAKLRRGEPHTYWDDFIVGLPIGTSTKPEWEITPGEPYPMFISYLTEKIKRGDNTQTDEQTRNEVFRILDKPRQAKAFWGQFKRSVVNVSSQVEKDRALGVSHPSTPVWTKERIEPSIEEAAAAGEKIMAVNGNAQAAIASSTTESQSKPPQPALSLKSDVASFEVPDPWTDEEESQPTASKPATSQPTMRELLTEVLDERNLNLKGFVKAMPLVSKSEAEAEERKAMKPKTNISQMSVAEINEYLADPVLRKQIMPQLWDSDYEFTTNEYGDIIRVKRPPKP